MNIRNLSGCAAAVWIAVSGCASRPVESVPVTTSTLLQTDAFKVLAKNLRAAYPPLSSYFVMSLDEPTVRVFINLSKHGYSCRVFHLVRGKTHFGQADPGSSFTAPSLTDVHYVKDHDITVIFSGVTKIQTRPSRTPASAGPDFPSFTDVTLLDHRGNIIDTITVATTSAGEVTGALLTFCPWALH